MPGAVVVAAFRGKQFVTRRITDGAGRFNFSGWAGMHAPAPHTVTVTAPGSTQWSGPVQIVAQAVVTLDVKLDALVG